MRKVYFITKPGSGATVSGKWRHTLKQNYKSTDAIRDIIEWTAEGREFFVAIIANKPKRKLVFHVNPPGSTAMITDFATKRPVVGIIDMILQWTQERIDFDITLLERKRHPNFQKKEKSTSTARLRVLGRAGN